MVRVNLMATVLCSMVLTTSLEACLCVRDTKIKSSNENDHLFFKTRGYARADELELYSRSVTLPVKRRHQPMTRFCSSCSRIVGG